MTPNIVSYFWSLNRLYAYIFLMTEYHKDSNDRKYNLTHARCYRIIIALVVIIIIVFQVFGLCFIGVSNASYFQEDHSVAR